MMWTLNSALRPGVPMELWEGNEPAQLCPRDFFSDSAKRANQLFKEGSYKCSDLAISIQQPDRSGISISV
jgi:hypothetical protein